MSARFTRPVMPGDPLTVQAWIEGDAVRFRTLGAGGHPVLDFGKLQRKP
jgi:acyl dehydratase